MTLKNKFTNFLLIAISIALPLFITDIILKKLKFPSSNSGNLLIGGGYSNGLGFRAVTHGDMTSEDIQYTLDVFESCLSEGRVAAA